MHLPILSLAPMHATMKTVSMQKYDLARMHNTKETSIWGRYAAAIDTHAHIQAYSIFRENAMHLI